VTAAGVVASASMWVVEPGGDVLGDLEGDLQLRGHQLMLPPATATAWAVQQVDEIGAWLGTPSLILPRDLVVKTARSEPVLHRALTPNGVSANQPLRLWLALTWFAQSSAGGLHARVPRALFAYLDPLVYGNPVIPPKARVRGVGGREFDASSLLWPGGHADRDKRRRRAVEFLVEQGYLVESPTTSDWTVCTPGAPGADGKVQAVPFDLEDSHRFAWVRRRHGEIELVSRLSTSGTWVPPLSHGALAGVSRFADPSPFDFPGDDSWLPDVRPHMELDELAEVQLHAPKRDYVYVQWDLLKRFRLMHSNEIVTLLAVQGLVGDRWNNEVELAADDAGSAQTGVPREILKDGVDRLTERGMLARRRGGLNGKSSYVKYGVNMIWDVV
jgi:hypothetical protein